MSLKTLAFPEPSDDVCFLCGRTPIFWPGNGLCEPCFQKTAEHRGSRRPAPRRTVRPGGPAAGAQQHRRGQLHCRTHPPRRVSAHPANARSRPPCAPWPGGGSELRPTLTVTIEREGGDSETLNVILEG